MLQGLVTTLRISLRSQEAEPAEGLKRVEASALF